MRVEREGPAQDIEFLKSEQLPREPRLDFESFLVMTVRCEGGGEEHFASGEEGGVAGVDFRAGLHFDERTRFLAVSEKKHGPGESRGKVVGIPAGEEFERAGLDGTSEDEVAVVDLVAELDCVGETAGGDGEFVEAAGLVDVAQGLNNRKECLHGLAGGFGLCEQGAKFVFEKGVFAGEVEIGEDFEGGGGI